MADDEIALKINIDADTSNMTLQELEKHFDAMQTKLKGVGRGSEEFKQLSTAMAGTTAEIKNIELGFEGLDRSQVASEFGAVAGGIGEMTASLILLGGESETIEQIGKSIQTAMGVSMAFKGVTEASVAARKLWNSSIKTSNIAIKANAVVTSIAAGVMKIFKTSVDTTSKSFKTLKTAIASTGIGLLVVGVAALVANFGKIKDAINGVSAASKDLLEATKLNKEANEDNVEAINNSNNLLRQQGYTEREIINMKIKANKKNLESQIAEFEATKLINKEKLEGSKRNQEMLQNTLEILFIIPRTILKLVDFVTKRFADMINDITQDPIMKRVLGLEPVNFDFGIAEGADELLDQATRFIFDPDAVDEAGKAEQKALEDNLLKQRDTIAGHELALLDLDKKASADSKKVTDDADKKAAADAEKAAADAIQLEKDKNQLLEDLEAKAIEDKTTRALAELEIAQERERQQLIEKYGLDTELLKALETEQLLQMNTLIADIEQEARENKATLDQEARDAEEAADQKKIDKKKAQRDKDFALATAAVGALSALNKAATDTALLNAAGDEEKKEKIRKASFEREKKLNIAMAAINGAQAVLAGFAQGGLPMAIVAGVTAAAQLAAIVATTYQGGAGAGVETPTETTPDGAGDAGGGVQLSPVSNTSTILGNQQVYVTETDITNTQNNVSVIEESATF